MKNCLNCRRSRKDELCMCEELRKNVPAAVAAGMTGCDSWAPRGVKRKDIRPCCYECQLFDSQASICNNSGEFIPNPSEHTCKDFKPYKTSPTVVNDKNRPKNLPGL